MNYLTVIFALSSTIDLSQFIFSFGSNKQQLIALVKVESFVSKDVIS
jgi:hypothetical protein